MTRAEREAHTIRAEMKRNGNNLPTSWQQERIIRAKAKDAAMDRGFTRDQARGAIPNGSRVVKRRAQPGDDLRDGDLCTGVGSVGDRLDGFGYWVEPDRFPSTHLYVLGAQLEAAE